jgi:hypothetical protein
MSKKMVFSAAVSKGLMSQRIISLQVTVIIVQLRTIVALLYRYK